jgi:hypothetical protein
MELLPKFETAKYAIIMLFKGEQLYLFDITACHRLHSQWNLTIANHRDCSYYSICVLLN